MSDKPKRRWFQFHLLTLVLISLAAGAMLWVNAANRKSQPFAPASLWLENPRFYCKGWPFAFFDFVLADGIEGGIGARSEIKYSSLILDGSVGIVIVVAIAFISESLLRRREARKT